MGSFLSSAIAQQHETCEEEVEREHADDWRIHACRSCDPIIADAAENCPKMGYDCDPELRMRSNVIPAGGYGCTKLRCSDANATLAVGGKLVGKATCADEQWTWANQTIAATAVCARKCDLRVCRTLPADFFSANPNLLQFVTKAPDADHPCAWGSCPNGAKAGNSQSELLEHPGFPGLIVFSCTGDRTWRLPDENRYAHVACTREAIVACASCDSELITITKTGRGSHDFDEDTTDTNGQQCTEWTLICKGKNANVEVNGGLAGTILDSDAGQTPGAVKIVVICNAAGSGWEYKNVVVTQLECASADIPCANCAHGLIAVTHGGQGAHPMDGDVPSTNGQRCAVRTFTCKGPNANIEINGAEGGVIGDTDAGQTAGLVTIGVTCNAAGTAWEYMQMPITQLECASTLLPCASCAQNLIRITEVGEGAQPMDGDVPSKNSQQCALRTFTCKGTDANIKINNGADVISDTDDGQTAGEVTLGVTCNAGGTGWEYEGQLITQLECSSSKNIPCASCAKNLITITEAGNGAHAFASDNIDTTSQTCAVRTFVCKGANANIEFNDAAGVIADKDEGQTAGAATFKITCNAANTAWEYMETPITHVECASFSKPS